MSRNINKDNLLKQDSKKSFKKSLSIAQDSDKEEIKIRPNQDIKVKTVMTCKNSNQLFKSFINSSVKFNQNKSNLSKNKVPINKSLNYISSPHAENDNNVTSIRTKKINLNTSQLGTPPKSSKCRENSSNFENKCDNNLNIKLKETNPNSQICKFPYEFVLKELLNNLKVMGLCNFSINRVKEFDEAMDFSKKHCNYMKFKDQFDSYNLIWKNLIHQLILLNSNKETDDIIKHQQNLLKVFERRDTESVRKLSEIDKHYAKIVSEKDEKIKELEFKLNEMHKERLKESNEIIEYTQKQLLRENKSLTNENKQMRELLIKFEHEIDILKTKEIKIMKFLFNLSQKGIPITDFFKELDDEQMKGESTNGGNGKSEDLKEQIDESIDNSHYYPIYIKSPKDKIKPECIPKLNLTKINENIFDSDATEKKLIDIDSNSNIILSNSLYSDNYSQKKLKEISKTEIETNQNGQLNNHEFVLNSMELALLRTYQSINKEKNYETKNNINSGKSTLNSEKPGDFNINSKMGSLVDIIKPTINIDIENISDQEIFSKSRKNLSSLKEKLTTKQIFNKINNNSKTNNTKDINQTNKPEINDKIKSP